MKKLFVLLAALALAGCNLSGGPGAKPPTHVALTGAKGLFLQSGGASKHLARAGAGTGTQLMQVTAGATIGPATFTAADGSTVNVNIDAVLQVNSAWLLVTYDEGSGLQTSAVSMSSGAMMPLSQVPNYFAQVRMLGTVGYYCSGTTLYKADFGSGVTTAIGSDGIAGNEYLHVTPAGDVYAWGAIPVPPQIYGQSWVFPVAGGSSTFINTTGIPVYGSSSAEGNLSVVEDQGTGNMWYVSWGSLSVAKFTFNGVAGIPGASTPLGLTTGLVNTRVGQQAYYQGSFFLENGKAYAFASDGSGGLTATAWNTSAAPDDIVSGMPTHFEWQTDGTNLYSAPCPTSNTVNLVTLPGGGGTAGDPVLVSDAQTITSFAVVGGQVLYTDATATYQQVATVGATASLYSATPVNVTPVGQ
jgi:hypothetical protein